MNFSQFMQKFTKNAKEIFERNDKLFFVNADKDTIWNTYLDSYPPEKNPVYRTRREYDCSCCKSFIRHFGRVVAIENNKIVTFWDFHTEDDIFEPMLREMSKFVKSCSVSDVFVNKETGFGVEQTRELLEDNSVHTWNHFNVFVPSKFIMDLRNVTLGEAMSVYRSTKDVFKRSLEEISKDSVQTVLDMIAEGVLYRGEEWKSPLEIFAKLQRQYFKIKDSKEKENYCWSESVRVGGSIAKIKNHSIGVLLSDITDGMEVEEAVRRYESIVAPTNYKRPKAIFTKKMIEDAKETLKTLGFENSLGRRFANIRDISINNVLWANRKAQKKMEGFDEIFESMSNEVSVSPKSFEGLKGISISDFLKNIPSVKSIEVLLENRHEGNFVSLIAPKEKDAKTMFKWNNLFSWSYNGNITDSMKERVKSAGGKVDGVLRFSLQWNMNGDNLNDFDAHCVEPNGNEIYYGNKRTVHPSSGMLDVDIINPVRNQVAVENIIWTDEKRMKVGRYKLFVHNYSHNGGTSGFDAEVEFDGQIYEFSYHKELRQKESVVVAEVVYKNGKFTIEKSLPHSMTSRKIWNLDSNSFVPVSVVMYSPNYWDDQDGIGNRHYFFMLNGCENPTQPNGFYNEYLDEKLMKHKKVFEALGSKMKVEESENQLSGLGFSSTKRDYIIAKVDGRITKIIF